MILIKVTNEEKRFIDKCLKYHINLLNITKKKNYLLVKVNDADLDNIVRLNYYSKIEIVKYYGIKGFVHHLKSYAFDYLLLLIFFICLYLISNVIVEVRISHESKELRDRVKAILIDKGIKPLSYRKSLRELSEISESILEENKDFLDFISINRVGMSYEVAFEERIINPPVAEEGFCHVVAKKDGIIKRIVASSGVTMVETAQFVHKGDILISGDIMLNEEVKDHTCAKGEVIGETWYRVNLTIPLKYEEKKYTEKSRYNFILNGNYLYRKNYEHYDEFIISKIDLFGQQFKIIKQQEFVSTDHIRSVDEVHQLATDAILQHLREKSGENIQILEQNVLKETKNDSTIDLEVFVAVLESIGETQEFEVGEESDTEPSH